MIPITNHAISRYRERIKQPRGFPLDNDEIKQVIWDKISSRTEHAMKIMGVGKFHISDEFTAVVAGGIIVTIYHRLRDRSPYRGSGKNLLKRRDKLTSLQKSRSM